MTPTEARDWIVAQARALGFDLCGVAPAADFDELARLPDWLARGYAGEMRYLHDPRRRSPQAAMPGAHSLIVCALNYNTPFPYSTNARVAPQSPYHSITRSPDSRGWVSRYAWGDDYHDVLGAKLDALLAAMRARFAATPFDARAYVDTGPVHERIAAHHAGLGWLGKNTCLINQQLGSWLFLGVILTTLELEPSLSSPVDGKSGFHPSGPPQEIGKEEGENEKPRPSDLPIPSAPDFPSADVGRMTSAQSFPSPHFGDESADSPLPPDLCGQCTQCLDACPTGALVAPYVLDARRCISYLTIELRGPIPDEFHDALGWHLFGCDICQDVCPFNHKAPVTAVPEFRPRKSVESAQSADSFSLFAPPLDQLASLSESDFRRLFTHSAIKRTKHAGLTRNAQVALKNSSR